MKLKELIAKALRREELNALERAELENFDPDALRAQLDEAERARMSREETLQRALDSARAERDALRTERDALVRRNKISALAADSGCTDPDYLDFLAGRSRLDLDDSAAVAEFMAGVERDNPHCFRSRLKPGTGAPSLPAADNRAPRDGADRIGAIVEALGAAPEIGG